MLDFEKMQNLYICAKTGQLKNSTCTVMAHVYKVKNSHFLWKRYCRYYQCDQLCPGEDDSDGCQVSVEVEPVLRVVEKDEDHEDQHDDLQPVLHTGDVALH